MHGKGDGSDKIKLADLEKVEFDVFQNLADQIQEDFEQEKKPGESFIDWLKQKPDSYFKSGRISIRLVVGECQMERSEAVAFLALELVTPGPWARCSLGTPKITSSQASKMH